jgi:hypothetical protein
MKPLDLFTGLLSHLLLFLIRGSPSASAHSFPLSPHYSQLNLLPFSQQVLPNPEDEGYLEPEYLKFDHSITSVATFASSKALVIAGYDTKTSQVFLTRYKWNETSSSSSLLFNDPTEVVLPLDIIKSPLRKLSFINCDESGEYLIALTESNWIFLFDAKKLEVITSVQFVSESLPLLFLSLAYSVSILTPF